MLHPAPMNDSAMPEANPVIGPSSFITLHYRITLESGDVLVSTFEENPATLDLGQGQLAEGLEACLIGLTAGTHQTFEVPAGQAYGERNPELIQRVSKKLLAQHAQEDTTFEVGDFVEFPAPNGGKFAGTVYLVEEDSVIFDFNHPLSGQPLNFEVQVIGVL